jgi:carbonic anhydrase
MRNTRLMLFAALGALTLATGACGDDDEPDDAAATTSTAVAGVPSPAHFSYEGEDGPEHWAELDEAYETCGSGAEQSPIDVTGGKPTDIEDPTFDWSSEGLEITNNGHTTQVNVHAGSTSVIQGETWNLQQFHWHQPSENTIDGQSFDMELHFVHANDAGELAVLAVLIEAGDANPTYDAIWAAQTDEGETADLEDVDITTLLPTSLVTTTFRGSLTTPPCTEGVNWNVLTTPVSMSAEQLEAFSHENNARPVQPTNDRPLAADNT